MVNNGAFDRELVSQSSQINPAIPGSPGALLAEEWTINPRSTLPSFVEQMMMEEARTSVWQTLQSLLSVIEQHLSRVVAADQGLDARDPDNVDVVDGTRRLYHVLLRRWPRRVGRLFLQKLIRPFGAEIRFFILYFLERSSLAISNATISESLYGGMRVKLGAPSCIDKNEKRNLQPIQKCDRIRLAFFMAFGPYLEERSTFFFDRIVQLCPSFSTRVLSTTATRTVRKKNTVLLVLNVLRPFLRLTTKGILLWYRWRYLLGKTFFFDPFSSWMDLVVRRVTIEDRKQNANRMDNAGNEKAVDLSDTRVDHIRKHFSELFKSRGLGFIACGFVSCYAALAWIARIRLIRQERLREQQLHDLLQREMQGQEQSQERSANSFDSNGYVLATIADKKPIPLPPLPASFRPTSRITLANFERNFVDCRPGVCSLCNEPPIHPTATTGGYIFCFKCLLSFVRRNGSLCPVTGKPCPQSTFVRLYEPTNYM
mmetsp:Transcript_15614/g.35981  ORF Transcript_15614/g.35981 Transcript_15614/m.35981 type:complete len:485 (+) Transcript_15614:254-1708(+)